ncbi:hypothetical protein H0H92_013350, partial [Tricholoma furcatifolium]
YIFPLIYLLVKRHLDIFHLACLYTLDVDEFSDKTISFSCIFEAFDLKLGELTAVFKQMSVDPVSHLKHYAFGMFSTSNDDIRKRLPEIALLSAWNSFPHDLYDEDIDLDGTHPSLLQYEPFDLQIQLGHDSFGNTLMTVTHLQDSIGGNWAGILIRSDGRPFGGVTQLSLDDPQSK